MASFKKTASIFIEQVADTILRKVTNCGPRFAEIPGDYIDQMPDEITGEEYPDQTDAERLIKTFNIIFILVLGEGEDISTALKQIDEFPNIFTKSFIQELLEFDISSKDRLLLKLIYMEGLTGEKAGKRLWITKDQVYGRRRRLLERLNEILKHHIPDNDIIKLFKQYQKNIPKHKRKKGDNNRID